MVCHLRHPRFYVTPESFLMGADRRQASEIEKGVVLAENTLARRARAAEFFGLTPEIVAVSTCMFLIGCGENLWRRFLPKYLQALGAPVTAIGLFGTAEDFLDGVYQYPGGWIADRFGRRAALILFISLAALGYVTYWL